LLPPEWTAARLAERARRSLAPTRDVRTLTAIGDGGMAGPRERQRRREIAGAVVYARNQRLKEAENSEGDAQCRNSFPR
jgi:hypothetical protein